MRGYRHLIAANPFHGHQLQWVWSLRKDWEMRRRTDYINSAARFANLLSIRHSMMMNLFGKNANCFHFQMSIINHNKKFSYLLNICITKTCSNIWTRSNKQMSSIPFGSKMKRKWNRFDMKNDDRHKCMPYFFFVYKWTNKDQRLPSR